MFLSVTKIFDLKTGVCFDEKYKLDGKLHRDPQEGPAWIERGEEGLIGSETYYWRGRRHRIGGPAVISYQFPLGAPPSLEMYYHHGKLHRDPAEGPALIERDGDFVTAHIYSVYGEWYRDPADGPYYVEWDKEQGITLIEYSPAPRRKSPVRRPSSPSIAPT